MLGRIAAEAGQVATVRLGRQAFGMQAFGGGDGRTSGVVVRFQAFERVVEIEQAKDLKLGYHIGC